MSSTYRRGVELGDFMPSFVHESVRPTSFLMYNPGKLTRVIVERGGRSLSESLYSAEGRVLVRSSVQVPVLSERKALTWMITGHEHYQYDHINI